ncbi:MAG: pyruvate ferredoxin oxidoreductase [candidate division Zixibacteria bacterium RBG_16_50_21]|nr:MAG: pyruvate ferredoxin oxidoreductase [candidate division Zixibacteria bacterium RBG_16_50_21]
MKKVITGNHAVAHAARLAKPGVVAVYPITPQTSVSELMAEFVAKGQLKARLIRVESEHSVMAALIGASMAGARTFTATSSQGLALMHELLHWAAGARLPIVMVNVNRSMGSPWTIWCDHLDSLSQRDTGWMQFYCESSQEALDTVLQAYKLSEQVNLPCMVNLDGFYLSHTVEPVDIPEQALVDAFLPPRKPLYKLDIDDPHSFGALTSPEHYYELRYKAQKEMESAKELIKQTNSEFSQIMGRSWLPVEAIQTKDAEIIIVTMATTVGTCRWTVKKLRQQGLKVGLVKLKMFRPFPAEDLLEAIGEGPRVVVLDRNLSAGMGGIIQQELKNIFYSAGRRNQIFSAIVGLGGRDITPEQIELVVKQSLKDMYAADQINWLGGKI